MQKKEIIYNGKTYKSIKHACEELNLSYSAICSRINKGWDIDKALSTTINNNTNSIYPDRVGEKRKMNNGKIAEIIEYNNANDFTIKWDDNTTQHCINYGHYKVGKVAKKENRVGQTKMQNCGHNATIIKYESAHNITVKFDDNTVVTKKYYTDFLRGMIKHPKINQHEYAKVKLTHDQLSEYGKKGATAIISRNRKKHIGTKNRNKNGQMMEIIEYRNWKDIDVKFDDKTIVYHQRMEKFQKGEIVNPNNRLIHGTSFNEQILLFYLSKLGFEKVKGKEYGLGKMELDCYNKNLKVAVEYDGEVHSFRPNTDINKDNACEKAGIKLIRIREKMDPPTNYSICYKLNKQKPFSKEYENILKELIKYLNNTYKTELIDISFKKDKEKIANIYEKNYNGKYKDMKRTSTDGYEATVKHYISSTEVIIIFEDNYEKTVNMTSFKNSSFRKYGKKDMKEKRMHMKKIMNNGMEAEIIEYRGAEDIDIKFADNTIVYNKSYYNFTQGIIRNPNVKRCDNNIKTRMEKLSKERKNETHIMNNGMEASILEYRKYQDIDVKFSDNTIVKNKRYSDFKKGRINNPNYNPIK